MKHVKYSDFVAKAVQKYYEGQFVLGKRGDFITSPMISQIFGETIAVWIMKNNLKKQRIQIVELGPGEGSLALDLIRSFEQSRNMKGLLGGYVFIEKSDQLKALQRSRMHSDSVELAWYPELNNFMENSKEKIATFIVAHEFFDALPVRKFKVL